VVVRRVRFFVCFQQCQQDFCLFLSFNSPTSVAAQ
jgi:hypothetical protein